jgi:cytochrome c oxidase subunit 2
VRVFCAEYCGTKHSAMQSQVVVHEPADFEAWMAKAADWIKTLPPTEAGALVYKKKGCNQCHSVDGMGGIGPTFRGSFGNRRQFADGSTGSMDENYIRESVLNPRAKVVKGFDPVMPTFQGRLKENEMDVLIAYLKSLSQ